jgi:hypothetical protein
MKSIILAEGRRRGHIERRIPEDHPVFLSFVAIPSMRSTSHPSSIHKVGLTAGGSSARRCQQFSLRRIIIIMLTGRRLAYLRLSRDFSGFGMDLTCFWST